MVRASLSLRCRQKVRVSCFLQSRLTGDFAYYRNLVDGLILDVPQSPSKGIPGGGPGSYGTTIPANVGSVSNEGIELNLRFNAIQNKVYCKQCPRNFKTFPDAPEYKKQYQANDCFIKWCRKNGYG